MALLILLLLPCLGQANSILVAGHDTTSFMLTSTLYWVARSPQVKAKVWDEIEAFGRSRPVTHADMDSFPYLEVRLLLVAGCAACSSRCTRRMCTRRVLRRTT
jgi:cytochrome P450